MVPPNLKVAPQSLQLRVRFPFMFCTATNFSYCKARLKMELYFYFFTKTNGRVTIILVDNSARLGAINRHTNTYKWST